MSEGDGRGEEEDAWGRNTLGECGKILSPSFGGVRGRSNNGFERDAHSRSMLLLANPPKVHKSGATVSQDEIELFHQVFVGDEPVPAGTFPRLNAKGPETMDSMVAVGFLDHERESETDHALAELSHLRDLPGGKAHPGAAKELAKIYSKDRAQASRMREKLKKLPDAPTNKTRRRKKKTRNSWEIYEAENRKISAALRDRDPSRVTAKYVRSRPLDAQFEHGRRNLEAVLKIQACWRKYSRAKFWKAMVHKVNAVRVIQRYIRGMLARNLLRVWLLRKSWLVCVAQACIRGFLTRKRTKKWMRRMQICSVKCQAIIRGYLARIKADYLLSTRQSINIQRVWRGSRARMSANRIWLDEEATKIQKLMRGVLGKKDYEWLREEAGNAATVLQRAFRGMKARWLRNDLLWHRETKRRRDYLIELRAEDEQLCAEIFKREHLRKKVFRFDEKLLLARAQCEERLDLVKEKEFDLEAMRIERGRIDPVAIRQGWAEELDKYVEEHRQWLTNAKFEFIFVGATFLRTLEEEIEKFESETNVLRDRDKEVQKLREYLEDNLRNREHAWKQEVNRRERRRKVADQKRRWRIQHFTESGKIRKHLIFKEEKEQVSFQSSKMDELFNQIKIQNDQNRIVQHAALLKPLFDGMQKLTGHLLQEDAMLNHQGTQHP